MKALIRILNGILLLESDLKLSFSHDEIYYVKEHDVWVSKNIIQTDHDLEYEELQSPFQEDIELPKFKEHLDKTKMRKNYIVDFLNYAYQDELVHEVLILFILTKIDTLLILINTSKIIENIEHDLGLDITPKERKKG
ncbi:hypothetical protein [Bacillus timonensis]|uniref:hypothetical protein n=1 Tax=Bacillus timonensis TaxID=1033734 RepID=UPI00028A0B09|nr:hypothetical protein [Bacillus timonensis]